MTNSYLSYKYTDSNETVNTYDELPLWSAPFGLLLLKNIELKKYKTLLDLGSGTGFPLLELAERLGESCKCFSLDVWENANSRLAEKIKHYNIYNVEVTKGSALSIPFPDNTFDLITSNLGINNFDEPDKVIKECHRVIKPGSSIVITTNINGHWKEFYNVFESTLLSLNKINEIEKLDQDQKRRGDIQSITEVFTRNGFTVKRVLTETFTMQFLNGTAFLNHHFIKLGWLSSWKNIIDPAEWESVFSRLEENLNNYAEENEILLLTVPMLYMEAIKTKKD